MEEISSRQKSMALWLREGGKCTKFFHQVENSCRKNNAIEIMTIDGCVSSEQSVIKGYIAGHFEDLLSEPLEWRPRLDNLLLRPLIRLVAGETL